MKYEIDLEFDDGTTIQQEVTKEIFLKIKNKLLTKEDKKYLEENKW